MIIQLDFIYILFEKIVKLPIVWLGLIGLLSMIFTFTFPFQEENNTTTIKNMDDELKLEIDTRKPPHDHLSNSQLNISAIADSLKDSCELTSKHSESLLNLSNYDSNISLIPSYSNSSLNQSIHFPIYSGCLYLLTNKKLGIWKLRNFILRNKSLTAYDEDGHPFAYNLNVSTNITRLSGRKCFNKNFGLLLTSDDYKVYMHALGDSDCINWFSVIKTRIDAINQSYLSQHNIIHHTSLHHTSHFSPNSYQNNVEHIENATTVSITSGRHDSLIIKSKKMIIFEDSIESDEPTDNYNHPNHVLADAISLKQKDCDDIFDTLNIQPIWADTLYINEKIKITSKVLQKSNLFSIKLHRFVNIS